MNIPSIVISNKIDCRTVSVTLTLLLLLTISTSAISQVKLPRLISDGMVLQRNIELKIWGWAAASEPVAVSFNGKTYSTKADASGNWMVKLPATKEGGPFTMQIDASNHITLKNILVGDVWICSGQSNMELTMERVKEKYVTMIATSENPNIRHFLVPDRYNFKQPLNDVENGTWESANPKNILGFSAVGYFFAKDIYEKYRVPIGLINSALGGSPAEAWMSEDALIKFPNAYQEAQRFKSDQLIEDIETKDRSRDKQWHAELNNKDEGLAGGWRKKNFDDSTWSEMQVPGHWADGPTGNVNGVVWFRRKVTIPKSMTGKAGKLWMGRIVDSDSVFVNGKFVGTTSYQYPPRRYQFGADVLKEGENTIAVRVINSAGHGGFVWDKPYFLSVDNDTIDLKGNWKFKVGATMSALEGPTAIRWKPLGLYNGMIAPLLNYSIKGVIWYQGEANTGRAKEYEAIFPAMIRNWREKWKQGDFPFLFVQLANFMGTKDQPVESNWAQLRQSQLQTLSVPNTAMAVAIDVGEWNDIHPLDKQTVGKRLALAAKKVAYGDKKIIYSGPLYQSHKIDSNKITISFSNTGSGLTIKGNQEPKYFAICGSDKKYVWAKAKIEGNKVVVWSDAVKNPVAVRYAWADNPEGANLYNKEGLPASPFTTDNK